MLFSGDHRCRNVSSLSESFDTFHWSTTYDKKDKAQVGIAAFPGPDTQNFLHHEIVAYLKYV